MLSLWSSHRAKDSIFQASYPIWSIGSFLSPLLIRGFLIDPHQYSQIVTYNATDDSAYNITVSRIMTTEGARSNDEDTVTEEFAGRPVVVDTWTNSSEDFTTVRYAYSSISSFTILTSVAFFVIYLVVGLPLLKRREEKKREKAVKESDSVTKAPPSTDDRAFQYGFLCLQFLFYYVYQHVEAVMGAYLSIFVVHVLGSSARFGAAMVSLLYGCQAVGRILGVPIAYSACSRTILWVNLSCLCMAHILFILVPWYGKVVLIISVVMSGLFQSTIFGSVMLYVSDYMPLTGFASAVIQIGSSTGKLVGFTFAAYMFDQYGPMSLVVILLASCVLLLLIFAVMNVYATCMKRPKPLVVVHKVD